MAAGGLPSPLGTGTPMGLGDPSYGLDVSGLPEPKFPTLGQLPLELLKIAHRLNMMPATLALVAAQAPEILAQFMDTQGEPPPLVTAGGAATPPEEAVGGALTAAAPDAVNAVASGADVMSSVIEQPSPELPPPLDLSPEAAAGAAGTDAVAPSAAGNLATLLSGVRAPDVPPTPSLSAVSPPTPRAVETGQLEQLMMALFGDGKGFNPQSLTLSQALARR